MYPGQLLDIRGLDHISWWPIAPGWWIVGALILCTVLGTILLGRYLYLYPPGSWRWEARRALVRLRRERRSLSPKQRAARLSELLRRISIARFGRPRIASLTGIEWLQCLQRLDPEGFHWPERGKILLTLPYAPEHHPVDEDLLEDMIQAALHMVRHGHRRLFLRSGKEGDTDV